ncbi:hypothetical protein M5C97_21645 [Acidovorax sp. NCPPB 3859]|nr:MULTISPECIES: hypothetical protein [unclassified Acidovorax]MDA8451487.1 hypothetical protein [Acidovorax sp. GBBC 3297]MDA8460932.1 hypothetical protein [Acidovorax sp. GBBC 3333]MDA8465938.1 hypothetical protein [Acidovorax sp. GBBC 3332]MDA8471002.1 hypothetical protein [Acidovorax sp. GBBC 3299]WCM78074.1 hypothetical protein M5C94_21590 [Acidovorax sp. GBBC 712]
MAAEELAHALVREISTRLEQYAEQAPGLVGQLRHRRTLGGDDPVAVARDMLGLLMAHALPPEPADVRRGMEAFNARQDRQVLRVQSIEWLDDVTGERRALVEDAVPVPRFLTAESLEVLAGWVSQLSPGPGPDEEPPPPRSGPSPGGI